MKYRSGCLAKTLILFTLLLLATAPRLHAQDNTGAGILHMRSQSPLQSLRMVMPLVAAGTIQPGWGMFLAGTWSNVWAEEESYYLDYEMLDVRTTLNYGFNNNFALGLSYDNRNYFGGHMDGFIQSFHDAFGVDQNGRDLSAKGLSRIGRTGLTGMESNARIFNNNGVTLLLSYDVTKGNGLLPAANITASLRYGLESSEIFAEKHPVDYGLSLGLGKRLAEKWYLHAIVSYTHFDQTVVNDILGSSPVVMEKRQFSGLFAIGYDYSARLTLLLQYMPCEAAVQNISGLNKPSHEIHLGFKYQTDELGHIEFGMIENAISFDNSPDFGLHLGWEYLF